ncbi:MAG: response regulator [Anaerolineaceae bacterium]|nr:response regulator [Anaerolineaceae bacterium]
MSDPVILYVEDDALSREVMQTLLVRGLGYKNVTVFESSHEFGAKLDTLTTIPDIIFLDIHVEPIDGFTMLGLIRQRNQFNGTRVVALTASVMNEEVKMLKEAGFNGVIAKPLNYETFPTTLRHILAKEDIWYIK